MGMALPMGGHLTHGWNVSVTGKWFHAVQYGVRRDTGIVDLDEVRDLARRERPKLIFCGGTAIPRAIDFAGFAEIADEVGAILVADIAHVAGLVIGGVHPSPVGHAPVIATTTHKTLRGPRGALLLCGSEHAQALERAVFPGLQGGPHDHTIAGIAVALHEAAQPEFRDYAAQIVANAKRLGQVLAERGFDLVSGGTDNHLLLIDLTSKGVEGKPAAQGPGPRRAGHQRQHRPLRPAQAVQPLRHPAGHALGDQPRDGARGDGADRPLHRLGGPGGEGQGRGHPGPDRRRGRRARHPISSTRHLTRQPLYHPGDGRSHRHGDPAAPHGGVEGR
jgi:hypothetical protein